RLRLRLQYLLALDPGRSRERVRRPVLKQAFLKNPPVPNGSGGFSSLCNLSWRQAPAIGLRNRLWRWGLSVGRMRYPMVRSHPRAAKDTMAKPLPAHENLLSVLPSELAAALFATARPHRLKADQTLFTAG